MEQTQPQRIAYFDVLRILATFAVIVLHLSAQHWADTDVVFKSLASLQPLRQCRPLGCSGFCDDQRRAVSLRLAEHRAHSEKERVAPCHSVCLLVGALRRLHGELRGMPDEPYFATVSQRSLSHVVPLYDRGTVSDRTVSSPHRAG